MCCRDYPTRYWQDPDISFDPDSGSIGTNVIKRRSSGRREIGYWITLVSSAKTAASSRPRLTDRWRYSQAVRSRFIAKILYWLLAGNLSISQYRPCLRWILVLGLASSPSSSPLLSRLLYGRWWLAVPSLLTSSTSPRIPIVVRIVCESASDDFRSL